MGVMIEVRTARPGVVTDDARTERGLPAFAVTCGAYRAIFPACPCGDDSDRVPCPLDYGHSKTARGRADGCVGAASAGHSITRLFCHGWHHGKVERFAALVAKTYTRKVS